MVSIIITLYNKENTIARAINSALKQTYRNCEIIVVDDCSNDNSEFICKKYGNQITYFRTETNCGVSYSRKTGIKLASGKFITFIDADDTIDFKKYIEVFKKNLENGFEMYIKVPLIIFQWN